MDPATTTVRPAAGRRRELLPVMRGLLLVFSVLTALGFTALFVLSTRTAESFAWTIQPPVTAAFLGAGYAAGCTLVVLSLRDPVWSHSRVPVLTILVFTLLTLVATLVHVDRFHFQPEFADSTLLARGAAWFWTAVYVLIPLGILVALVFQERAPGADPPRRYPVPVALRAALAVESVVLLAVGAAISVTPSTATTLWPWTLTPLTARVVGAWLIAFGIATALAALAGDLERLRTATIAYTVFGVLQLVVVLLHRDHVAWDRPVAWLYVAAAVAVTITGAEGWRRAPVPARHRA
ncbi:hypothetical protein SAMN05660359_00262 [Geodermatophilus obscurus]|uniref:Uncharacterized protein n=1 Tax=Geodermatophilus obscurus TaxID=1861 RepID=A0A1I5CEC5_9ACTN|nr:hypothetical protein [Geodermatophilus obscurus]SFN85338.1 hypothetical protein SAMN05660359_00262 [Geodermatophilus obscurus]